VKNRPTRPAAQRRPDIGVLAHVPLGQLAQLLERRRWTGAAGARVRRTGAQSIERAPPRGITVRLDAPRRLR
jgi:hypothetical protein